MVLIGIVIDRRSYCYFLFSFKNRNLKQKLQRVGLKQPAKDLIVSVVIQFWL